MFVMVACLPNNVWPSFRGDTVFNQNKNIIYGIDADCDTECIGIESAWSPELNSQNSMEITDLNEGLQPEEEIDLCSDDDNQTMKSSIDLKTDKTENMTETYKMVDSENEEISKLLGLIQKKNAEIDSLKSANKYLQNKCDSMKIKTNQFGIEKFSENDSAIRLCIVYHYLQLCSS